MDLLETLADSLVKEITVEYGKDNNGGGTAEENERKQDIVTEEDLDTFIENIVTESLNKVLELNRNHNRDGNTAVAEDHEENSFPKGSKNNRPSNDNTEANSMVSNNKHRSPPANDGTSLQNIKQSPVVGNRPDDMDEQTVTAVHTMDERKDYSDRPQSFNSVLASMLQELLVSYN